MRFNTHSMVEGRHAFLSASNYAWLEYDDEKLDRAYLKSRDAEIGTRKHALAAELINLGIKLPDIPKTMNMYVNDAIGYKMTPEQILYFSENCFGTADAISFRDMLLRISDLKTGVTRVSMKQLLIYAAIFCLEYRINPIDIMIELRIYQSDRIDLVIPDPLEIQAIMSNIRAKDRRIREIREELNR